MLAIHAGGLHQPLEVLMPLALAVRLADLHLCMGAGAGSNDVVLSIEARTGRSHRVDAFTVTFSFSMPSLAHHTHLDDLAASHEGCQPGEALAPAAAHAHEQHVTARLLQQPGNAHL